MTKKSNKAGSTASVGKPRLLHEGWLDEGCDGDPVFYPDRGYCVQGSKVWFAFGKHESSFVNLFESGDADVVESYDDLELVEKKVGDQTVLLPKDGRWIVEGPAQRSDVKNANQRTYSRKIWENLIADGDSYVQEAIRERRMIGHLEHPKDGRTDLRESAVLTVGAKLLEDGTVWGRFEILETPNGLILQELTKKRVKWGVSSRGTGTVGDDGAVSEEDYRLKTWDAVASPSTPGAHPNLVTGHGKQHEDALDEAADPKKVLEYAKAYSASFSKSDLKKKLREEQDLSKKATSAPPDIRAHMELRIAAIKQALGESNTERETQGALSEELQESLDALVALSESEPDDLKGRVKLRRLLLDTLASLDESKLQELLLKDQGWAKIAAAVQQARQAEDDGASIDAAIEEALASGEDESETAGFMEVIETLQEQVSDSVQEARDLQERLEAAESERDAQAERLVEAEGELARLRAECDLAHELLSETPGRNAGDVAAAADEAISEVPALAEHRALLESVGSPAQVRTLAKRLAPSRVEEAREEKPKRAARAALPVGLALDETDHVPSAPKREISESSGARIVAAMPGFKK